jgi:UDP:flavonoid glycosyltransferase YjiC (YdhE family)
MNILILCLGSHGDVHPFVGLGQALERRGHAVRVASNDYFRDLVRKAGLKFAPMGSREQFEQWMSNPDVWHPTRGGPTIFRGVAQTLRAVYDTVARHLEPDTVLVASSLCMGAVIAAEHLNVPIAVCHLAPLCVRSLHDMPRLPGPLGLGWMPMWMRRKFWDGADKWVIDPPIAPAVNALRGELGLAPVERVLLRWWHGPHMTLGLWPEWYAKPQPDWPETVKLTGFPMYDEADVTPLAPELDAWLRSDPTERARPIAFTPGSAMKFGQKFFFAAAEACRRLGRRGLLLTRHAEQIPRALPDGVIHVPYAPFSQLLPRVAALVHHGGIGTTAQALRAGVPQLIAAMSHDQFDNGERVKRLGCGDWLPASKFSAGRVTKRLGAVLGSPQVRDALPRVAAKFAAGPDGLTLTCDAVESLAMLRNRPAAVAPSPLPLGEG